MQAMRPLRAVLAIWSDWAESAAHGRALRRSGVDGPRQFAGRLRRWFPWRRAGHGRVPQCLSRLARPLAALFIRTGPGIGRLAAVLDAGVSARPLAASRCRPGLRWRGGQQRARRECRGQRRSAGQRWPRLVPGGGYRTTARQPDRRRGVLRLEILEQRVRDHPALARPPPAVLRSLSGGQRKLMLASLDDAELAVFQSAAIAYSGQFVAA